MMLRDMAASAHMPAAKAHRYMVSLCASAVEQDAASGRYDLGGWRFELGLSGLARLDPVRLVWPVRKSCARKSRRRWPWWSGETGANHRAHPRCRRPYYGHPCGPEPSCPWATRRPDGRSPLFTAHPFLEKPSMTSCACRGDRQDRLDHPWPPTTWKRPSARSGKKGIPVPPGMVLIPGIKGFSAPSSTTCGTHGGRHHVPGTGGEFSGNGDSRWPRRCAGCQRLSERLGYGSMPNDVTVTGCPAGIEPRPDAYKATARPSCYRAGDRTRIIA